MEEMVGSCKTPEEKKEVVAELHALDSTVSRLSENFIALRKRLDVACQKEEETSQDQAPEAIICPLAGEIRINRKRLETLASSVCRTIDLLQI